ncbi:MAG: hypothetical protein J1E65_02135 [Lachnospiraceae bacterium]|nr:hypothetical protein [Lachnospiraceae bacterium]
MKKKKILACFMACAMVLALPGCGEEKTKQDEGVKIEGVSVDFEDGLSGFVMMSTAKRKADDSVLSVKDYNGSKALFVENQGGAEMYVGIDADALLGDKITDVRYIQMDIGTEYADGSFSSSSGYLYVYTGEELKETEVGKWSVYLENANPKTVLFDLGGVNFTAGNDNYIMLVKDTDNGATVSSLYIDNIVFADASGKSIAADTSAVMEPVDGFLGEEKEEEEAPAGKTVMLDDSYAGDWGGTAMIPAEELQEFASTGVTITFDFELESGYDYYLINPIDANWTSLKDQYTDLVAKDAAEDGDLYHLQADGFIVIDDWSNNKLTFTLPAESVAAAIETGGILGQTYGVTVVSATLVAPGAGGMSKTVAMDEAYAGDWGGTAAIPAEELQGLSGDVTITFRFELESGYDYYLINPMDASWTSFNGQYTDLVAKDAAEDGDLYHLQADGFIVIDNWDNNELTFTLPAASIEAAIAAGGIMGQTYGVTVYEAVISTQGSGSAAKTVAMDDSYAGDWGGTAAIPAEELQDYASTGVKITFKFELESGYDYYLINPMDAGWTSFNGQYTDLVAKAAAEDGDLYHLQADGFIVIDDWDNGELTFTLPAESVQAAIEAGGIMGQTYGVTVYEAKLQ